MGGCLAKDISGENPKYISKGGNSINGTNEGGRVGEILKSPKLKVFEFAELKAATMDFNQENILVQGCFGSVYKGWIDGHSLTPASSKTGMIVTVKIIPQNCSQGLQEWVAEVKYLGLLCHPNIVKLIGYCTDNDDWLLVYEYMPNGSLKDHIFPGASSASGNQPLGWDLRLKAALGAARGLAFLHNQANVIFRDFNTSTILLDSNYEAKLAYFGLAKDGPVDGKTHVTTRVMGAEWYSAPEYNITGHLSVKSDVYSFGVVLLEILTGRQAMERNKDSPERNLVEWAKPLFNNKRKVLTIFDPFLKDQRSPIDHMLQAAQLAMQCLSLEPKERPPMEDVVNSLQLLLHH